MAQYISPEDVRKESMSFEILVMNTIAGIQKLIPEVMREEEHPKWFALEASILGLDALVAPYYEKEYNEAVEKVIKDLGKVRSKAQRVKYMYLLHSWLKEIVKRFGYVDILPPNRITLYAETREDYMDDGEEGGEEDGDDDNAKVAPKAVASRLGKKQHDLPDSVESDEKV